MHASIILLLASPLLALAAPVYAPNLHGMDITVYDGADCKGKNHQYTNMKHGDAGNDKFTSKSYKLSRDLTKNDYLYFGSERPFVATGDDAKRGCHNLKDGANFFLWEKSG